MIKIGLFAFGSLGNLLLGFEIASDLSFIVSLPIALIVAPWIGFYAHSYPKLYKKELSQVQWKQDQSKLLKFTYDFIDSIQEKKFVLIIIIFYFLLSLYFRKQLLLQDDDIFIDVESISEIKSVKEHHNDSDLSIEKAKKHNS
jgi:hypothetical protein